MCEVCHQYQCPSSCPNAPAPTVFGVCSECGCDIYIGEDYYEVINEYICEDCMWEARKTAEVEE